MVRRPETRQAAQQVIARFEADYSAKYPKSVASPRRDEAEPLAFFDFPGLDVGEYAEVLGGLHHIAISVEPEKWEHLKGKLAAAGVEYLEESGTSIYFRDPNGARLELIADPLGEMYGTKVM